MGISAVISNGRLPILQNCVQGWREWGHTHFQDKAQAQRHQDEEYEVSGQCESPSSPRSWLIPAVVSCFTWCKASTSGETAAGGAHFSTVRTPCPSYWLHMTLTT